MTAQTPVDDFQPPWTSFASFFFSRDDSDQEFLIEVNHELETRTAWSVGAWRERVRQTTEWLLDHGVEPGGRVATLAGNSADALAIAYSCWVLGACVVPLNPNDSLDRQRFILGDAKVSFMLYSAAAEKAALEICSNSNTSGFSVSTLPRPTKPATGWPSIAVGDVSRAEGLDLPALRVYTSGTTGNPKAVMLTAANLLVDCDGLARRLDWPQDTRVLTVLPIHHVNGLVISSLLPWYLGLSTVLCDRFRSSAFWDDVDRETATVCSVVPSLLEFLLEEAQAPPAHFREILCGAGPLLVETALNFEQRFSIPVRHLYGLSETTAVLTLMPTLDSSERSRWHRDYGYSSVGPAIPHVNVAVADDSGVVVDAGVRGELVARGAVVMKGYASSAGGDANLGFREGWFRTGDEGFWEPGADGSAFFFVTGRIKELIIRGGSNISPFEIDSVIRSHPDVQFGLAVPFENRYYGEEIAAYVVASDAMTEADLIAHCAQFLDFSRCPKVIIFGDSVPYTATGKPKRLELKTQLAPALSKYRDVQFRRTSLRSSGPATP